jgi:hypothetical protein
VENEGDRVVGVGLRLCADFLYIRPPQPLPIPKNPVQANLVRLRGISHKGVQFFFISLKPLDNFFLL